MTKNINLINKACLAVLLIFPCTLGKADRRPEIPSTITAEEVGTDPSVAPGDDFFAFANGEWLKHTQIPSGLGRWTTRNAIEAQTRQRLAQLFKDIEGGQAGDLGRLVSDHRRALLASPPSRSTARAAIMSELRLIDRIDGPAALARYLGRTLQCDVDPLGWGVFSSSTPFGLAVAQGVQGEPTYRAYLLQGGLGLPGRDAYLSLDAEVEAKRLAYLARMTEWLSGLGSGDARIRAQAVLDLESAMSRGHVSDAESDDLHRAEEAWTLTDFELRAPWLDWRAFLAAAGLGNQRQVVVWHPKAIKATAALAESVSLATWRDYFRVRLLERCHSSSPSLSGGQGRDVNPSTDDARREWAEAATAKALPEAVAQLYVERNFRPEWKAHLQRIAADVTEALCQRIPNLAWMTDASKDVAVAKLHRVYFGMAYPERWFDHRNLHLRPDDAVGNVGRLSAWRRRIALARLGQPVDRKAWLMPAHTVGAVLMPFQNTYNFAAGLLQPPKFDPTEAEPAIYGAIGAIAGHEICHFIDPVSADYDAEGRYRTWWSAEDKAGFQRATDPLVAQLSAYHPLPGLGIDGPRTLGESSADLGGLVSAFDAYRARFGNQAKDAQDLRRMDRQFFIGFARAWRSLSTDEELRKQLATDTHPPERYRVAVVRNLDAWYSAFDVQPSHRLYLAPNARVRIW